MFSASQQASAVRLSYYVEVTVHGTANVTENSTIHVIVSDGDHLLDGFSDMQLANNANIHAFRFWYKSHSWG